MLPYAYEHAPLIRETWDDAGVHPRDITTLADFREPVRRSSTRTRCAASATSAAIRTAACARSRPTS